MGAEFSFRPQASNNFHIVKVRGSSFRGHADGSAASLFKTLPLVRLTPPESSPALRHRVVTGRAREPKPLPPTPHSSKSMPRRLPKVRGGSPPCTIYWTGNANDGNWSTISNWSLTDGGPSAGSTPHSTDVVCMSTNPANAGVTVSVTTTIAGLEWPQAGSALPSLTINGGSFTISPTHQSSIL